MDVRKETSQLRGWFEYTSDPEAAGKTLVRLWEARAWEEYGHASWRDYCGTEFPVKPKWDRKIRRDLVGVLDTAGMAQRDTASALGVDQKTISNDLASEELSSDVKPSPGIPDLVKKVGKTLGVVRDVVSSSRGDDLGRVRWGSVVVVDVAMAFSLTAEELQEVVNQIRSAEQCSNDVHES